MPDFILGSLDDPYLKPDVGAGVWGSKLPNPLMMQAKVLIQEALIPIWVAWPDASQNVMWYFANTGWDKTIDLEGMVNEVPSSNKRYGLELKEAKDFAETLPEGIHQFTSAKARSGYNMQGENNNWFFAIGGHWTWSKGTATVFNKGGWKNIHLNWEYKFWDRYNWDGGKSVTLPGGLVVTDEMMGEFHRQGLACEYNCKGSMKATWVWQMPMDAPAVPVAPPPAGGGGAKPPSQVKTHTVKSGESLSLIAQKYYGDMMQWPKIYEANKKVVGPNPNLILPGQVLVIP